LSSTLESMTDVSYCPRCQGFAMEESTLGQCCVCSYSYCTLCRKSFHGVNFCSISSLDITRTVLQYMYSSGQEKKNLENMYGKQLLERQQARMKEATAQQLLDQARVFLSLEPPQ